MGYFLLHFAFVAIPALLSLGVVYPIAAQMKTKRRRNIFFLLSCVVPLAGTILAIFIVLFHPPFTVYEPLGLLMLAWFVLLIGLGAIIGAIATIIIWKRKQKRGQDK